MHGSSNKHHKQPNYILLRLLSLKGGAGHTEGEGVAVLEEVTEQQQRFSM